MTVHSLIQDFIIDILIEDRAFFNNKQDIIDYLHTLNIITVNGSFFENAVIEDILNELNWNFIIHSVLNYHQHLTP